MIKDIVKEYLVIGLVTAVLSVLFFYAAWSNTNHGTKYDLPEIRQYITYVLGILVVKHGINSGLNSPIGRPTFIPMSNPLNKNKDGGI